MLATLDEKGIVLSPTKPKLGLIVSELALLSKQLDQFTSQAVGVSSATASRAGHCDIVK